MIDRKLLQPYSVLAIGEQINIDHEGCDAGVDRKKRLYIKHVVGGVVAYCHHCSDHGFWRELSTDGTVLRKWLFNETDDMPRVRRTDGFNLRPGNVHSADIINWLAKHHVFPTTDEQDRHYFKEFSNELYLPIHNYAKTQYGYQLRSFDPTKSKYKTTYYKKLSTGVSWFNKDTEIIVITEDYTSAYRVWRDTPHASVALLKTSIPDEMINLLVHYKKVVIWLDPDEPGQKASLKILQRLMVCLPSKIKIKNMTSSLVPEPKNLTPDNLRKYFGL